MLPLEQTRRGDTLELYRLHIPSFQTVKIRNLSI